MADKATVKTPFGELPCDGNNIVMSNSQLMEQYEKHGIANPKEVLDAVATAKEQIQNEIAEFLASKVDEDLEPWSMRAGLKQHRFEVTVKPEQAITIPGRNGAPTTQQTRYCVTTIKNYSKTPSLILENPNMRKYADSIEKKLAKPSIKVA